MAFQPKVLGQLAPAATTLTALYTVPGATKATASSIVVANTSSVTDTFRVSIAIAGAADTIAQYIYRDVDVPGNDTFIATVGITLATTDVVRCFSTNGTLSFNLFGIEEA